MTPRSRIPGVVRFRTEIMDPEWNNVWLRREERAGSDIAEGIKYHWELAGPNGACFFLLVEAEHTELQVQKAARYLRQQHDVVRLWWVDMARVRRQAEKSVGARTA